MEKEKKSHSVDNTVSVKNGSVKDDGKDSLFSFSKKGSRWLDKETLELLKNGLKEELSSK